jgi:HD-GYP domain-containing protein (c-di-GMP phosphodiesterase class II)
MSEHARAPRAVVDNASAPEDPVLVERHRRFVIGLYQTIKVAQLHEFTNQAMNEPLANFMGALDELLRADGSATLSENEGHLFVNGRRFAPGGTAFHTVAELCQLFTKKKVGGFRFERRLDRQGVQLFLAGLAAIPSDTADGPSFLKAWLAQRGGAELGLVGLKPRAKTEGRTVAVTLATRARLLYAKLLVLTRELLGAGTEDGANETFLLSRLKRALQEIVSTSEQAPLAYLGLVNVKNYDDYVVNHSANVAVISILLGRKLGLERRELCELGVAAALHDSGKVHIPVELLSKARDFTPDDRQAMARHPVEGVLALLRRARSLDRATMCRLVVMFEHNTASNGYPEKRQAASLHLYSRIVAVVDAYDALTTARPYRRAYLPDEALGEIRRGAGTRFDATVVKAFASLLGIYPQGTFVVLSTGERGIVLHNDLSDVGNPRPIVKVLIQPDGRRTERIVDLAERGEDGGFQVSIVGTDDPARFSIAVAAYAV